MLLQFLRNIFICKNIHMFVFISSPTLHTSTSLIWFPPLCLYWNCSFWINNHFHIRKIDTFLSFKVLVAFVRVNYTLFHEIIFANLIINEKFMFLYCFYRNIDGNIMTSCSCCTSVKNICWYLRSLRNHEIKQWKLIFGFSSIKHLWSKCFVLSTMFSCYIQRENLPPVSILTGFAD